MSDARPWKLLTNHALVMLTVDRDPSARLRDIARTVGITERSAQNCLRDLKEAGLVLIDKQGGRNHYRVDAIKSLRHPLVGDVEVRRILDL